MTDCPSIEIIKEKHDKQTYYFLTIMIAEEAGSWRRQYLTGALHSRKEAERLRREYEGCLKKTQK